MNLLPINANWFCHSTLTTAAPPPPFSSQPSDTHCNFTGHLIRYLVHNKSIVISKKGGGPGGGGGADMRSRAGAADGATLPASRLIPSVFAWPFYLFIFIELRRVHSSSRKGGVQFLWFRWVFSFSGFLVFFHVCLCVSSAYSPHISDVYRVSCVCVCLLLSLCVWKWKSRDKVRGEVERWCVSCHRSPLCLHVDLLDLQLTNLSASLIFLPKGGT